MSVSVQDVGLPLVMRHATVLEEVQDVVTQSPPFADQMRESAIDELGVEFPYLQQSTASQNQSFTPQHSTIKEMGRPYRLDL